MLYLCHKIDARTSLGTTRDYFNKYYYLYELYAVLCCAMLCCCSTLILCTLHRSILSANIHFHFILKRSIVHITTSSSTFFILFFFVFCIGIWIYIFTVCWLHDSKLLLHTNFLNSQSAFSNS